MVESRRVRRLALAVLAALIALTPGAVAAQDVDAPAATPDPVDTPTPEDGGSDETTQPAAGEEPADDELPTDDGPLTVPPAAPGGAAGCVETAVGCVDPTTLAELLADFEAAAEDEQSALIDLGEGLDRLDELERQLSELNDRVAEVNLRLLAARSARRYADIRVEVARQNLADVEQALADEEALLQDQAVAAFMGGSDERELDQLFAILRAESGLEIESIRTYSEAVLDDQQRSIDRVAALRLAVEGMGARLDEAELAAQDVEAEIADIESSLEELWDAHRDLVAQQEVEVEGLGRIVGEIRERKDEYAAELFTSTAGATGSIAVLLRERQGGQALPERTVGFLSNPVPGALIVSNYGPRLHPILGYVRIHAGVDIDGAMGAPVRASADGVVVLAEEQGGYGLVTVIDHGNGIGTVYAHQSAFAVEPGDVVERGDLIGFVGSTGLSTGPHVHFEVRLFGHPVDPMAFLDLSDDPDAVVEEGIDHHESTDDAEGGATTSDDAATPGG